jgi:DNA mismatch repair ATPase MutL
MSILSTLLVAAVCSAPQLSAQQSNPSTAQQPPETASQQPQQPTNTQPTNTQPANTQPAPTQQPSQPANQGTTVNPSQAPLQPVTTYPDASDTQQQPSPNATPQTTTTIPEAPQPKKPAEPVGAATAESVPTTGGAAAKPAGVAIAPAKQHQTRSLMIKIGAALAAGAALGTVYALSHGTSSTPPGTGLPGVTGR